MEQTWMMSEPCLPGVHFPMLCEMQTTAEDDLRMILSCQMQTMGAFLIVWVKVHTFTGLVAILTAEKAKGSVG